MPSLDNFKNFLKGFWDFLKKISPLIALTSVLVATGVFPYISGIISFELIKLIIFSLHLVLLSYIIFSGFGKFDESNMTVFSNVKSFSFYLDETKSDFDINYLRGCHLWSRITNYWKLILVVWIILYTWFLTVKGVNLVKGVDIPPILNTFIFNILNNLETVFILLSLTYLIRGWRNKDGEIAITPYLFIVFIAILTVLDIALKMSLQSKGFDYSVLIDFISGILTGIFFGLFISKLNSRFIGFPNFFIIVLFLYCCFMTVYPVLDHLVFDIDPIVNRVLGEIVEIVIVTGFCIALVGKIILIQLFYWEEYSIKFFVYLMSLEPMEKKYQLKHEKVLEEFKTNRTKTS